MNHQYSFDARLLARVLLAAENNQDQFITSLSMLGVDITGQGLQIKGLDILATSMGIANDDQFEECHDFLLHMWHECLTGDASVDQLVAVLDSYKSENEHNN